METKLFVGNLSRNTTEEDLSKLFTQAGTVNSIELIAVGEMGSLKCFAFVDMDSQEDAQKAINMLNGSSLNRRAIKVNIARPREARPVGGGWYHATPVSSPRNPKNTPRRKAA